MDSFPSRSSCLILRSTSLEDKRAQQTVTSTGFFLGSCYFKSDQEKPKEEVNG